jgi:hypothetical protein
MAEYGEAIKMLEAQATALEDAAIRTAKDTSASEVHAAFYVELGKLRLMAADVLRQRALALAKKQERYSGSFGPADHSGARTLTVNPATEAETSREGS